MDLIKKHMCEVFFIYEEKEIQVQPVQIHNIFPIFAYVFRAKFY